MLFTCGGSLAPIRLQQFAYVAGTARDSQRRRRDDVITATYGVSN